MAKLLTGSDINTGLENLFREVTSEIILISPYIKLHDRLKSELMSLRERPEISIRIVFGKNEDNLSLSLGKDDLSILKEMPNIEIRHEKRLHAKYYANENTAILTSMNLYDHSQNNNIEFGILLKASVIKSIAGDGLDTEAYLYFVDRVIKQSKLLYKREPNFESSMLGMKKVYKGSVTRCDITEQAYTLISGKAQSAYSIKGKKFMTSNPATEAMGYCIRTGKPMPFNPKCPMIEEAYQSWNKFSNPDYPEKFCHFSGEPSNGETTFAKPILRKNWQRAKEAHGL